MKLYKRSTRGFTLIELMMVVAVVGVLAAIAYPSYQEQVRKGKRAEGRGALLKGAQMQERYYTTNNAYSDAATFPTLFGLATSASVYSGDGTAANNNAASAYTITLAAGTTGAVATSFVLTATPNFMDTKCGALTLSNTGLKGVAGYTFQSTSVTPAGSVPDCW
jgi:type IV pilus assembly protein PilE